MIQPKKALVANTEIMDVNTDAKLIEEAKTRFLQIFDQSIQEYGLWFVKDTEKAFESGRS